MKPNPALAAKKARKILASAPDPLKPDPQLLCKLGSVVVHAEELLSPSGHAFDRTALETLFRDKPLRQWINQMSALGMMPVKRS